MSRGVMSIERMLFAGEEYNTYAILDGAAIPELPQKLHRDRPQYECLFKGELEPDMEAVAPYLVALNPGVPPADWIVSEGWGKNRGIFVRSRARVRTMRGHFRNLVQVFDSTGRPLIFRFYDPRVIRDFLPTCTSDDLAKFFGVVAEFVCEDANPEGAVRFTLVSGELRREEIQIAPRQ